MKEQIKEKFLAILKAHLELKNRNKLLKYNALYQFISNKRFQYYLFNYNFNDMYE